MAKTRKIVFAFALTLKITVLSTLPTFAQNNIGGIVGSLEQGTVINCYNKNFVSGNQFVGGIAGSISANSNIINSYSVGVVEGSLDFGSIAGVGSHTTTVTNSFFLQDLASNEFGVPKIETEMKSESFVQTLNNSQVPAVWKFDTNGINDGYPILVWQTEKGTGIVCGDGLNIKMTIHPNETTGKSTLTAFGIDGETTVEVIDLQGTILHTFTVTAINSMLEADIDISGYASGSYFVRITNGKTVATEKLIKR